MGEEYLGDLGMLSPGREITAAVETPSCCKAESSGRSQLTNWFPAVKITCDS